MTWLAFLFALEFGLVPAEVHATYWPGSTLYSRSVGAYTMLEAEVVLWDTVFFGGVATTYMSKGASIYFRPSGIDFDFSAGLYLGPVTLAYVHRCQHPIITTAAIDGSWRQAASDRVYIRIEGGRRLLETGMMR